LRAGEQGESVQSVGDEIRQLMAAATVPGLAAAIIRDGRLAQFLCCGSRHAGRVGAVDENTVFAAASLSKPVFAYAVLQLAEQGRLSLSRPLADYLPDYIPDDVRAASISAADVLSHSAGLPNWRSGEFPLKTHFPAGERFSYSGEGFLYLQQAVEAATGEKTETIARQLVFEPLGMARSSFVWHDRFEGNRAWPHDSFGRPGVSAKPGEANVAGTLQTTAADYARLLLAVLEGTRLAPETAREWLRPRIEVRHPGIQCLGASSEDTATGVAWGLG
jgi:CubicO group peptidase (beta-lactamase class C family)